MTSIRAFRFSSVLLLFILSLPAFSQTTLGLHSDNFAGVYALGYNPAEIVDSRYKFHINLASASFDASSNYISLDSSLITSSLAGDVGSYINKTPGTDREFLSTGEVSILPSFIINFGGKEGSASQAIGFSYKARYQSAITGLNLDNSMTRAIFEGLINDISEVASANTYIRDLNAQLNFWNEYAFTYGRTLRDNGKTYMSIAATFKVTQGYATANLNTPNGIDFGVSDTENISLKGEKVNLAYSKAFDRGLGEISPMDPFVSSNIGFGMDIGAVWEYRPDIEDYAYEVDKKYIVDDRVEKYKLKVGLSVMDLGYVPFSLEGGSNAEYLINSGAVNYDVVADPIINGIQKGFTLRGLEHQLSTLGTKTEEKEDQIMIVLPTRVNGFVDYNIGSHFYANFSTTVARQFSLEPTFMKSMVAEVAITPRYERRAFSMYIPVSYNTHQRIRAGVGFRLGPLVFGSKDLLGLAGLTDVYGANAYVGLSIPIGKRFKDKDGDHISDDKDKCPDVAGLSKFKGCPDTDGDGVPDDTDQCVEDPGTAKSKGCPDRDEDGVADRNDDCVSLPGEAKFKGCPDTDGDGLRDPDDLCPNIAGSKKDNGCPEGMKEEPKIEEVAKEEPKLLEVVKEEPKIEEVAKEEPKIKEEPKQNLSPEPVEKPVAKANTGAKQQLEEKLTKQFDFKPGSLIITKESYDLVAELATFLKDNPDQVLYMDGHTDNQGPEEANLELSEARLSFLKSALILKGIEPNRVIVKAWGESKPIASNATPEGRRKNRRVEFKFGDKK